jgi:hypothetical protein
VNARVVKGFPSAESPCVEATISWEVAGDAALVTELRLAGRPIDTARRSVSITGSYSNASLGILVIGGSTAAGPIPDVSVDVGDVCLPLLQRDGPSAWLVGPTSVTTVGRVIGAAATAPGVVDVRVTASDGTVLDFPSAGASSNSFVNFEVTGLPSFDVVDVCWRARNGLGATDYECRTGVDLDGANQLSQQSIGCGIRAGSSDPVCSFSRAVDEYREIAFGGVIFPFGTLYSSVIEVLVDSEQPLLRCTNTPGVPPQCEFFTTPGDHIVTVRTTSPSGRITERLIPFTAPAL